MPKVAVWNDLFEAATSAGSLGAAGWPVATGRSARPFMNCAEENPMMRTRKAKTQYPGFIRDGNPTFVGCKREISGLGGLILLISAVRVSG